MLSKGLLTLLLAAGLAPAVAFADVSVWKFYGYAYDLDSDAYLYTEVHHQNVDGEHWLGGVIDYYTPAGQLFAHKTLDFSQDKFVPLFRLEQPSLGYFEAITGALEHVDMQKRATANAPVKTGSVDKDGLVCADSGFHTFLREHFASLMGGETVTFHLAVAGSLDSFKFRGRRVEDTKFEGKPAVRFRVEPDTWLRFLTDPLELTYNAESRMLLEYRGISNVRDPATGKVYHTRIAYYSQPPADAPKSLPPLDPPPPSTDKPE